jgi:hypothetical protein
MYNVRKDKLIKGAALANAILFILFGLAYLFFGVLVSHAIFCLGSAFLLMGWLLLFSDHSNFLLLFLLYEGMLVLEYVFLGWPQFIDYQSVEGDLISNSFLFNFLTIISPYLYYAIRLVFGLPLLLLIWKKERTKT